jgi:hypothetical protein
MFLMLILLLFLSPRFILFLMWLLNNPRFNAVFPGSFLVPLLGFIFLPWTTLTYFLVFNPLVGYLTGWDWFWIILGVFADMASYGSTRYRRTQVA